MSKLQNIMKDCFDYGSTFAISTVKEIGANVLALKQYPLGILKENKTGYPHPVHSRNKRPILLVHGIIHNHSAFRSLKRKLEALGWHNIYTLNYTTSSGSLYRMAGDLSEKVERIINETHCEQLDIVAHSLGGLVARKYMSIGEGRGRVSKLITLGTPHKGTELSKFLRLLPGSSLCEDLKPNSYWIRTMNNTSIPKFSHVHSIYSDFDWTVWPKGNCKAMGSPHENFSNTKVNNVGHAGLLFSDKVFRHIVEYLNEETFLLQSQNDTLL